MTDTVRRSDVLEALQGAVMHEVGDSCHDDRCMLCAGDAVLHDAMDDVNALPSADSALLAACRAALPELEAYRKRLYDGGLRAVGAEVEQVHALVAAAIQQGEKVK